MDLVFSLLRLHFMFGDFAGIKRDIRKARAGRACATLGHRARRCSALTPVCRRAARARS